VQVSEPVADTEPAAQAAQTASLVIVQAVAG